MNEFFNPDAPAKIIVTTDAKGDVTIPKPAPVRNHHDDEWSQFTAKIMSQPRAELACLLSLVQPKVWMAGNWVNTPDGWRDVRHDVLLSFDGAREMIADRIKELRLNPVLVYAYPESHLTMDESVAFGQLSFERKMEKFR